MSHLCFLSFVRAAMLGETINIKAEVVGLGKYFLSAYIFAGQ